MENKASKLAWATVGASILAYDLLCPKGEQLSEQVDRWLIEHPRATYAAVGAVTLHLLNVLPPQADIVHQVTRLRRDS